MSNTSGISTNGYSAISGKDNRDSSYLDKLQEKLFNRVYERLQETGVEIKGRGSFALDVDPNGKIKVIGNIENKEEVAEALNGDRRLLNILQGRSGENINDTSVDESSKWDQKAFILEVDGEKVEGKKASEIMSMYSRVPCVSDKSGSEESYVSTIYGTSSYYNESNFYYDTDEFGFQLNTGIDFAFKESIFSSREERDALFNYMNEEITSKIEGLESIAGMSFTLEQINQSSSMSANNYVVKVKSALGEDIDRLVEGIINGDSFAKNQLYNGQQKLRDYQIVVDGHYSLEEQNELNIRGVFALFYQDITGVRHYSPETESNKEGVAAAKEMWDVAKNISATDLEYYQNNAKIFELNDFGKKYGRKQPYTLIPANGSVSYASTHPQNSTDGSEFVSTTLVNTEDIAPGTEVATAKIEKFDESKTNSIIRDNGNMRDLLGLNAGMDEDLSTLLSDLTTKIKSLNEGVSTQINDILAEQGMTLGEDEKVDIGVAEDGTITVTANEGGTEARARAEKLQEALNSNSDTANELAGSLQELDINQTALTELVTDHGLSNDTAHRLYKILPDSETKKQLSALFEGDEDIAETEFSQETKAFTISNGAIINDDIDATLAHLDRTAQFSVMTELMRYNEVSYDDETGELLSPEAPPDMRIQSYEAILDEEGNIEVIGGLNGEGNELNGRLKGIAEKILDQDALGTSFKTLATLLIEKHGYEDSDTDEYEHEVKISVDYSRMDISYEVISPEADQAAEKELGDSLREISQSVSSYLEEEYGFDSPVEIKVDENGKLSASTDSLTDQQTMQLESVIEMLNQTLVMSEDVEEGESTSGAAFTGGLKEAFDGVTGLKDILAKFHDKENLYKAIG